jgi:hypothetical protein
MPKTESRTEITPFIDDLTTLIQDLAIRAGGLDGKHIDAVARMLTTLYPEQGNEIESARRRAEDQAFSS